MRVSLGLWQGTADARITNTRVQLTARFSHFNQSIESSQSSRSSSGLDLSGEGFMLSRCLRYATCQTLEASCT